MLYSVVLKTTAKVVPVLCAGCQLASESHRAACKGEDARTALCHEQDTLMDVEAKASSRMAYLDS